MNSFGGATKWSFQTFKTLLGHNEIFGGNSPSIFPPVKSVDPGLGSDQTFIALLRNEAGSEIRKDLCRLGEQILKE